MGDADSEISIQCPSCEEKIQLELDEIDGADSVYCGECSTEIPLLVSMNNTNRCPQCDAPRKRRKDGQYNKFCFKCRYEFSDSRPDSESGMYGH